MRLRPTIAGWFVLAGLAACGPVRFGSFPASLEDRTGSFRGATALGGGRVLAGRAELTAADLVLSAEPGEVGSFESARAVLSALIFQPNEVLVSWNVRTPPGTGAVFEVKLIRPAGEDTHGGEGAGGGEGGGGGGGESPWLWIGSAGDREVPGGRVREGDGWTVDVDYLRRADPTPLLAMVRVRWVGEGVRLRTVSLVPRHGDWMEMLGGPGDPPEREKPLVLAVPFRSQKTDRPDRAGRLCSPTCIAMVLAYYGVDRPVAEVADLVYDREHDLYGNWPRNVQAAYELGVEAGVEGSVESFQSWPAVAETLARGTPIIASIYAEKGELAGAPYPSTDGHLIVIRGFDERGDVLVNDPAAATPEAGVLTYSRRELTAVWFRNTRGTAYVLRRPPER